MEVMLLLKYNPYWWYKFMNGPLTNRASNDSQGKYVRNKVNLAVKLRGCTLGFVRVVSSQDTHLDPSELTEPSESFEPCLVSRGPGWVGMTSQLLWTPLFMILRPPRSQSTYNTPKQMVTDVCCCCCKVENQKTKTTENKGGGRVVWLLRPTATSF